MFFSRLTVKLGCIYSIPVWPMGFPFLWQEKWAFGLKTLPSQLICTPAPADRWIPKQKYRYDAKRVGERLPPEYVWHGYKVGNSCCSRRAETLHPPEAHLACHKANFCCCLWEWMILNCDHTSHGCRNQSTEAGFLPQHWSRLLHAHITEEIRSLFMLIMKPG